MALTDTFVKNVKPTGAVAGDKHADGLGLYLHVKEAGKYWRMNYRMSSNWKSIGTDKARQHPLYGIKGWLLVFAVGNFIGPLLNLGRINAEAMRYNMSIGQILSIEGPEIAFLQSALYLEFALAALTIFLIFTKNQHFRLITIAGRLGFWPILGLVALSQGIAETGNALAQSFFPWAVSCAVWVTYLQRSKRVRVTFERCIRNDEQQITPEPVPTLSRYTNQDNATIPPTAKPLVAPINERPMARQESEMFPVDSPARKAAPPAKHTNNSVTPAVMNTESSTEEDHWATAMAEVESGQRRPGVWAKAFAESEGDETKAKVAYLKSRVQQLTDAEKLIQAQQEVTRQQAAEKAQAEALERRRTVDEAIATFAKNKELSNEQLIFIVQFADTPHLISLWNSITGNTLLHVCAERDMLVEVDALLKAGADPQRSNNNGKRPEFMAKRWTTRLLISGTTISVDQLKRAAEMGLEQDGDMFTFADHKFQALQEAIDYAIAVSKMPQAELRSAVLGGNWSAAKNLLDSGVSPLGKDVDGRTLLDHAKEKRDKLLIDLLEYHGAE